MPDMPDRRPRPPLLRAAQMQRPVAVSLKVASLQANGRPHASSCRTAELAVELDGADVGSQRFLSNWSRVSTTHRPRPWRVSDKTPVTPNNVLVLQKPCYPSSQRRLYELLPGYHQGE